MSVSAEAVRSADTIDEAKALAADTGLLQEQNEFAPDRQPWEKQPWETDNQWNMFRIWRDLDPHERTYREAAKSLPNITSSVSNQFHHVAKPNRWRERVNAYDAHVDRKIREQLEARRMRARLETANLGRTMREKAREAVTALQSIITTKDEDGNIVVRSSLSPSEITQLAKVGRDLESVALEGGVQGGGVAVGIQINIGDSELKQRAREVLDAQSEVEKMTSNIIDITPTPGHGAGRNAAESQTREQD